MVQWANSLGATVIACVSTAEKGKTAEADGAHHVIIYSEKNLVQRVKEITNGAGVQVVYDSVGKDTIQVNISLPHTIALKLNCPFRDMHLLM